jgi:hypothetical protein
MLPVGNSLLELSGTAQFPARSAELPASAAPVTGAIMKTTLLPQLSVTASDPSGFLKVFSPFPKLRPAFSEEERGMQHHSKNSPQRFPRATAIVATRITTTQVMDGHREWPPQKNKSCALAT